MLASQLSTFTTMATNINAEGGQRARASVWERCKLSCVMFKCGGTLFQEDYIPVKLYDGYA